MNHLQSSNSEDQQTKKSACAAYRIFQEANKQQSCWSWKAEDCHLQFPPTIEITTNCSRLGTMNFSLTLAVLCPHSYMIEPTNSISLQIPDKKWSHSTIKGSGKCFSSEQGIWGNWCKACELGPWWHFFAYFHQLQFDQHVFSTDLELGCGLLRSWQELGIGSFSGDSLKLAKIVMDKNSYEFSSFLWILVHHNFFGHEMAPLVEGLHWILITLQIPEFQIFAYLWVIKKV